MLIIRVSLISPPPTCPSHSSTLSYSPRLKMGWPRSAIPRTTRYGYLSFQLLRDIHEVDEGFIQVECDGFAARPHCTRHPTTIAPPTLIMHPNGTYDWSYGLYPLIWQPGCYFSRFLTHFCLSRHSTTVRSVRSISDLHAPAVPSPPICHPFIDAVGQYVNIRCLRVPTSDVAKDTGCCRSRLTVGVGCGSIDRWWRPG